MNPERHRQIADLYHDAEHVEESQIEGFLRKRCGDDEELIEEVLSLLAHRVPTNAARPPRSFEAGEMFARRYRIVTRLGAGGMGVVYRADDTVLGQPVALKILIEPNPHRLELMLNEVRLARRVTHPSVCRVYDIGEDDGKRFLTMQLIEGEDLASLLRRIGRIAPEKVLDIARQIADGLAAAHASGVFHRDLKPANVMIDRGGHAIITDFGIATTASGPSLVAGTPGYMAPEQLAGDPVTERVDIYAFGAVVYELLTGELPRSEGRPARADLLVPPSHFGIGVDPRLEELTLAALCGDPADRPESAEAIRRSLEPNSRHARKESPRRSSTAERRHLTFVSCGIILRDGLDPEEHKACIGEASSLLIAALEGQGGFVPRTGSNPILAYFGFPRAREDDPRRAVRAALALSREVGGITCVRGLRIGVHSGSVVVEPDSGAAFGDALTHVDRIATDEFLGSVVMSESTRQLVAGQFRTRPTEHEGSWTVLAEVDDERDDLEGPMTPIIGRQHELAFLRERWARASRSEGQIVSVIGEPGVGKTRLVSAFLDELSSDSTKILTCRCSMDARTIAFGPVAQLLHDATGIDAGMSSSERRQRLIETLPTEALASDLAALVGADVATGEMPPNADVARRDVLEGAVRWLLSLGENGPATIVIEDLHWSDPSSLELLGQFVEMLPPAPLLVVVTFRNEFEAPWPVVPHAVPLLLDRLGDSECRDLVRGLAGGRDLQEDWVATLIERSDGNPLFVEEIMRAWCDEHDTSPSNAVTPFPEIPVTLEGSLMARLDRLGPAKEIAQTASIIGREFSEAHLVRVADPSPGEIAEGLQRLVGAQVLVRRGLGDDRRFAFRHALLREKAYFSCLKSQRREVHDRVAAVMDEERGTAAYRPDVVAWHLQHAERPLDSADRWAEAGHAALAASACGEATENFRRALDQVDSGDAEDRDRRELAILVPLGLALIAFRGYADPEVEDVLKAARELCSRLDDTRERLPVLIGLFWFHHEKADRDHVGPLQDELDRVARAEGGEVAVAISLYTRGFRAHAHRQACEARRWFTECLEQCDRCPEGELLRVLGEDPRVISLIYLSYLDSFDGRGEASRARSEEALALARALDHPYTLALALTFAGVVAWLREDEETAGANATEAIEISRSQAFRRLEASSSIVLGAMRAREGDVAAGLEAMRSGNRYVLERGAYGLGSPGRILHIEACLDAGLLDEARAELEDAIRVAESTLETNHRPELYRLMGRLVRLEGDEDAGRWMLRALEDARRVPSRLQELRALLDLVGFASEDEERTELLAAIRRCCEGAGVSPESRSFRKARALLQDA